MDSVSVGCPRGDEGGRAGQGEGREGGRGGGGRVPVAEGQMRADGGGGREGDGRHGAEQSRVHALRWPFCKRESRVGPAELYLEWMAFGLYVSRVRSLVCTNLVSDHSCANILCPITRGPS